MFVYYNRESVSYIWGSNVRKQKGYFYIWPAKKFLFVVTR